MSRSVRLFLCCAVLIGNVCVCSLVNEVTQGAVAQDDEQAEDSPLMRMLKSGRIPESRQLKLIESICQRGSASELGYVLEQTIAENGFSESFREPILQALKDAVSVRKVIPQTELTALTDFIAKNKELEADVLSAAIDLAGALEIPELADSLGVYVANRDTPPALRRAAINQLAPLADDEQLEGLKQLALDDEPKWRDVIATALVEVGVEGAAEIAAQVVADAKRIEDLDDVMAAILARQSGASELSSALSSKELSQDAAKVALRFVYSIGQNDADLVALLSEAAGISLEVEPLDAETMKEMVAQVRSAGDPVKGELIFRRPELSCFNCHAIGGAGGNVGPDLSAIGGSSPPDYLINAIMVPDQDVKEAYATKTVLTIDGIVLQGIVQDEDDERMVLKEATGKTHTIPVDDIEDEVEGGSLMPKGLRGFLTDDEFVDLVAFLGQLGRPGPYAVRDTPRVQKWQVLRSEGEVTGQDMPLSMLADLPETDWHSVYSMVAGDLPWKDVAEKSETTTSYLRVGLQVVEGGEVAWEFKVPGDATLSINGEQFQAIDGKVNGQARLEAGVHWFYLAVDTADVEGELVESQALAGLFSKPEGSTSEFQVIGGP